MFIWCAGCREEALDFGDYVGVCSGDVFGFADVGGEVVEFEGLALREAHGLPVSGADGLFRSLLVEFPVEIFVLRLLARRSLNSCRTKAR